MFLLVIVRYLDFMSVAVLPLETDAPLIVDSDAMLSFAISLQFLQVVRGRNLQVVQVFGVVDHAKLTKGHLLNVYGQFPRSLSAVNLFSFFILERLDHL